MIKCPFCDSDSYSKTEECMCEGEGCGFCDNTNEISVLYCTNPECVSHTDNDYDIETWFAQRANEVRNPLSGEELVDETVKLLKEPRSQGDKELLSSDELLGYFNDPNDSGDFILDLESARNERAEVIMEKHEEDDEELSIEELKYKLSVYRDAIGRIGTLGHIDIGDQYEKAFDIVLQIASDAYVDSGDAAED